jgi:hypothetical protein
MVFLGFSEALSVFLEVFGRDVGEGVELGDCGALSLDACVVRLVPKLERDSGICCFRSAFLHLPDTGHEFFGGILYSNMWHRSSTAASSFPKANSTSQP